MKIHGHSFEGLSEGSTLSFGISVLDWVQPGEEWLGQIPDSGQFDEEKEVVKELYLTDATVAEEMVWPKLDCSTVAGLSGENLKSEVDNGWSRRWGQEISIDLMGLTHVVLQKKISVVESVVCLDNIAVPI